MDASMRQAAAERPEMLEAPVTGWSFLEEAGRVASTIAGKAPDEVMETAAQAMLEVMPEEQPLTPQIREQQREEQMYSGRWRPDYTPARSDAARKLGGTPEVTFVRDLIGAEEPTTAGGRFAADMGVLVAGAAIGQLAAPGVGQATTGVRIAGKGLAAVGRKLAPMTDDAAARQAARTGPTGGQKAWQGATAGAGPFGFADFAAFDDQDEMMLVALTENTSFARYFEGLKSDPDPDEVAWKNRWLRLGEGGFIGGLAGAGLEAGFRTVWNIAKRQRKYGRPSDAMEHPQKEQIREAQKVEAMRKSAEVETEAENAARLAEAEEYMRARFDPRDTPLGHLMADLAASEGAREARRLGGLYAPVVERRTAQGATDAALNDALTALRGLDAEGTPGSIADQADALVNTAYRELGNEVLSHARDLADALPEGVSDGKRELLVRGAERQLGAVWAAMSSAAGGRTAALRGMSPQELDAFSPRSTEAPEALAPKVGAAVQSLKETLGGPINDWLEEQTQRLALDPEATRLEQTRLEGVRQQRLEHEARQRAQREEQAQYEDLSDEEMAAYQDPARQADEAEAEPAPARAEVPDDAEQYVEYDDEDLLAAFDDPEEMAYFEQRIEEEARAIEDFAAPPDERSAEELARRAQQREVERAVPGVERLNLLSDEAEALSRRWRQRQPRRRPVREHPDDKAGEVPHYHRARMEAMYGFVNDSGLSLFVGPAYRATERDAVKRLREADAAPGNAVRRKRALDAIESQYVALQIEMRTARQAGWEPNAERLAVSWSDMDWGMKQRIALRDLGRVNPDLDESLSPDNLTARPEEPVTVRSESVSTTRSREPEDMGAYELDTTLRAQDPRSIDGTLLPDDLRGPLQDAPQRAVEFPVDVHFRNVHSIDDFERIAEVVADARPDDLAPPIDRQMEHYRQQMDDAPEMLRQLREEGAPQEELAKLQKTIDEASKEMRRVSAERPKIRRLHDDAVKQLRQLLVDSGYSVSRMGMFPSRVIRDGLDGRQALHMVEALTGSLKRMSISAADDTISAANRAQGVRAWFKAEAMLQWIRGNDKAAQRLLRKAEAELEPDSIAARQTDILGKFDLEESTVLANKVRRRYRDHGLISQAGGSLRVQARMAAMALSETDDARKILTHLNAWRREAEPAWTLAARTGVKYIPGEMMRVRLSALLSAPKTLIMNLGGGVLFTTLLPFERLMAAGISIPRQGLSAASRQAQREIVAQAKALPRAIADGSRLLAADIRIRNGSSQGRDKAMDWLDRKNLKLLYEEMDHYDRMEGQTQVTATGVPIHIKVDDPGDTFLQRAGDVVSQVLRVGARFGSSAMSAGDLFIKGFNYNLKLRMLASELADMEVGRPTKENAEEWELHVRNTMKTPPEQIYRAAKNEAHMATFTGESHRLVEKYVDFARKYPAVRIVSPYIRTPSNVAIENIRRLPFGHKLMEADREAMRAGGAARETVLARQAMGMIIGASAAGWYANGYLTGPPPQDEALRHAWRVAGKKPYSAKSGDTWFDYRQVAGPYAMLLSIGAAVAEFEMAATSDEQHDIAAGLGNLFNAAAGQFLDSTFLAGWIDLASLVENPGAVGQARELSRLAESFVPLGSALRSTTRFFHDDGVMYDDSGTGGWGGRDEPWSEKFFEEFTARINSMRDRHFPWLSKDSDRYPRRDPFGEPVNYHHGAGIAGDGATVFGFLSPMAYTTQSDDPAMQEMLGLGYVPRPEHESFRLNYGGARGTAKFKFLEPTRAERDYWRKESGRRFRRDLNQLIKTRYWLKPPGSGGYTREQRVAVIGELEQRHRNEVLREMQHEALKNLRDGKGRFLPLGKNMQRAQEVMSRELQAQGVTR